MRILGIAEGPEGGAALVIDDRLVAAVSQADVEGVESARLFPWLAAERALALGDTHPDEIDLVMVAGRFVPMFLRRRPVLRQLMGSPFSMALDAAAAVQSMLRSSGLGAFEADVAAEWMDGRFRRHGYQQRRTVTVEVHRALAEAAYRLQPVDPAVVLTVHPLGDGVALAVHVGACGQLDRVHQQSGVESLHTHLRRCLSMLGLEERQLHRLGVIAAGGKPDARLDRLLAERFSSDGGRLSRASWPRRTPGGDPVQARVAELPVADAAASLLDNLALAVEEVARWHLRQQASDTLCVAGRLFEEPRIVARLAEMPEVGRLSVLPSPGPGMLAIGGAVDGGGLAPHRPDLRVGWEPSAAEVVETLTRSGLSGSGVSAPDVLARGGMVARMRGRSGPGRIALGARCVLTRADDPGAAARIRRGLALPKGEEPVLLLPAGARDVRPVGAEALGETLLWGVAAVPIEGEAADRVRPCLTADGRAVVQQVRPEDELHELVLEVRRRSGCPALLAWPLAEGGGPLAHDVASALEIWRRSGVDAFQVGAATVGRTR